MVSLAGSGVSNRPTLRMVTVALLAFTGALGLLGLPAGLADVGPFIFVPALLFSGLRFVSAYWLWRGQLWAPILGFVVTLLDTLLALPGVFDAPNGILRVLSTIGVMTGIPLLILLGIVMFRRANP